MPDHGNGLGPMLHRKDDGPDNWTVTWLERGRRRIALFSSKEFTNPSVRATRLALRLAGSSATSEVEVERVTTQRWVAQ